MIENYRIRDLSPYGKIFVGIFTALVLGVLLWVAFIYYVDKGMVDEAHLPAYLTEPAVETPASGEEVSSDQIEDVEMQDDAGMLAADSEAVLAPIWDSNFAGREVHVDSVSNIEHFRETDSEMEAEAVEYGYEPDYGLRGEPFDVDDYEESDLRHNVGLAHTHINGQTLLYFALGFVFLFTGAPPRTKKIVYWVFGVAILCHAIGLSGQGFHWFFDDVLAVSGVTIVVVMAYMALVIFMDLGRKRRG
jgi:hypothetical protein